MSSSTTPVVLKDTGSEKKADYYFNSYAHFGIHAEMIKDEQRTLSYRRALSPGNPFLKGKVVLDVGCGTGILSMFAVQAGAKHVYAVECSDIIDRTREIIEANGMGDRITLFKGKAEEMTLPCEVDVIVSEWMGYCLLYESMLDTVIYCRDRWLRKDGAGIMYPDKATLVLSAIEDAQYRRDQVEWWQSVYGFDMSAIKRVAMLEPLVDVVPPKILVSDYCVVKRLDLLHCARADLSFTAPFRLVAQRDDWVHALVAHFDVEFTACARPFAFSTGPDAEYTHWKQTVFYLETPVEMRYGQVLSGAITISPNNVNPRDLDIEIAFHFNGQSWTQAYMMR